MPATASIDLHRLADEVAAIPFTGMIAAAKAAKQIAAEEGTRAGGPLKGKKKRGLKLRARDDIRPAGADGFTCRIQGVSPAGWVWVTTGTSGAPHPPPQTWPDESDDRSPPRHRRPGRLVQGDRPRRRRRAPPVRRGRIPGGAVMAGKSEQIRIDLTAQDNASRVIDKVADAAEDLEKLDPEVEVTADASRAEADVESLGRRRRAAVPGRRRNPPTRQVDAATAN